jgi:Skp family chaperone for outer membrane proteins
MKTRFMLVFMISILFQLGSLKAQENKPVPNENNNKTIEESATRLVVNKEMINRFNQCDTEGKLISWSDLVMGFDSQSLSELYLAYQSADLNSQTLEDIKMALEDKQSQHLNNSNISDNDLAWFNQVKQEVNSKLRRTDMVVQR